VVKNTTCASLSDETLNTVGITTVATLNIFWATEKAKAGGNSPPKLTRPRATDAACGSHTGPAKFAYEKLAEGFSVDIPVQIQKARMSPFV